MFGLQNTVRVLVLIFKNKLSDETLNGILLEVCILRTVVLAECKLQRVKFTIMEQNIAGRLPHFRRNVVPVWVKVFNHNFNSQLKMLFKML